LVTKQAEGLVFEQLLLLCQQQGWLQARGRQRTDSTHVLAAIRGRRSASAFDSALPAFTSLRDKESAAFTLAI
jgi:hypothetical protein